MRAAFLLNDGHFDLGSNVFRAVRSILPMLTPTRFFINAGFIMQDAESSATLGSSPEGSFGLEMLRFMEGNVAVCRSRRPRRKNSRGAVGERLRQRPSTHVAKTMRLCRPC